MKYTSTTHFDHSRKARLGVLLTNLGSPEAPTAAAVRPYLKEFLSDPRVVEIPRLLWWFILNGVILRLRPRRSAAAYAKIWSEDGSPLTAHTRAQAQALAQNLKTDYGDDLVLRFAMRYGQPALQTELQALIDQGVTRLLVLPLYPQYSCATTASTFDAIADDFRRRRALPALRFVTHYHDFPPYIDALAASIRRHWAQHGQTQKLILSYHGEPQSYLDAGDPYHCECHKTSRLLAEALELAEGEYLTTFQSRFGRQQWLKPYTDEVLKALPGEGITSVEVVCPGFSADCLETLEEIDQENREYFMQAGGERFDYIPCLNSEPEHIAALGALVRSQLAGWEIAKEDGDKRLAHAKAQGASD